jgi:integrase
MACASGDTSAPTSTTPGRDTSQRNLEFQPVHPCRNDVALADDYLSRHGASVLPSHRRAITDILACRTQALGGHLWRCNRGRAWVCAYTDKEGTSRLKSFKRKSDADAFQHKVVGELKAGTHVPHRKTVSLREAADIWYHACEARRLGRSSLDGYERMKEKIVAKLGGMKLNDLTVATVREFEIDYLQENSVGEAEKTLWAFKQILAEAQTQGLVGQNVVLNLLVDRKGKKDGRKVTQKHKVKVGVDYPTPEEMRIILATLESANAKSYLKILTLAFCGLRCNELRALRRQDVEVSKPPYRLHVQQGVDRWGEIGLPKTTRGERTIDLGPTLVKAWREYLLKTPKTELDLAFPSQHGGPLNHSSTEAVLKQAQVRAGIVNAEGRGKYSPHDLRHYFASWCINRKEDGGLAAQVAKIGVVGVIEMFDALRPLLAFHFDDERPSMPSRPSRPAVARQVQSPCGGSRAVSHWA